MKKSTNVLSKIVSSKINPRKIFVKVFFSMVSVSIRMLRLFNTLSYKQGLIILTQLIHFAKFCFFPAIIILDINITYLTTEETSPYKNIWISLSTKINPSKMCKNFASKKIFHAKISLAKNKFPRKLIFLR